MPLVAKVYTAKKKSIFVGLNFYLNPNTVRAVWSHSKVCLTCWPVFIVCNHHLGGEKGNTGALLENRKCLYVWICMNLFLQRACVWFRLYVRSCSVRHYSARSYVCALTNTHTESVSFQCFLVFVQLWGVVTVKNNNKIIKNLMSSQHHCSKYTKKKLVCMKIMEKNCISTLLVFFFFFFLQVSHL